MRGEPLWQQAVTESPQLSTSALISKGLIVAVLFGFLIRLGLSVWKDRRTLRGGKGDIKGLAGVALTVILLLWLVIHPASLFFAVLFASMLIEGALAYLLSIFGF